MNKQILLYIFISVCFHNSLSVANLKYFETLNHVQVKTIVRRSVTGSHHLSKHISFKAFHRDFKVSLEPGTNLLTEDFRAKLVNADGSFTPFEIDRDKIFSGYVTDRPDIFVHAHMEETLWTIQIFDTDDTYAVEPAWRLLNSTENPNNDSMVAYRASDFRDNMKNFNFCGGKGHKPMNYSGRTRRQTVVRRASDSDNLNENEKPNKYNEPGRHEEDVVCSLFLVGDYTFFKGKCQGYYKPCASLMLSYITVADRIYKASIFRSGEKKQEYVGIGFAVREILLYTTYTSKMPSYPYIHFNENVMWEKIQRKLCAFGLFNSVYSRGKRFCLAHLLTDFPFNERVLGLAYMNSLCYGEYVDHVTRTRLYNDVAQCESAQDRHDPLDMRNCAVSSGTDSMEGPIPTVQMNLVIAHELGHNFGSEHDAENIECSAPDNMGGNYIMWSRSVTGKHPNNFKFSPCSLNAIGNFIGRHAMWCFQSRSKVSQMCGDGAVDEKEGCDAGSRGINDMDPCCTSNCSLRPKAICSEVNQDCCLNCSFAPKGTLCQPPSPLECQGPSHCSGIALMCPPPRQLPDWTQCRNNGFCYRGICRGYCESRSIKEGVSLKDCACQTNEKGAACMLCCFNYSDPKKPGPCQVYSEEIVSDGGPCFQGVCKKGVCISYDVDTIERIYQFFPGMSPSAIGMFMKANIVFTVFLISIFMWLPMVYCIRKADQKLIKMRPSVASRRSSTWSKRSRRTSTWSQRSRRSTIPKSEVGIFTDDTNKSPTLHHDPTHDGDIETSDARHSVERGSHDVAKTGLWSMIRKPEPTATSNVNPIKPGHLRSVSSIDSLESAV